MSATNAFKGTKNKLTSFLVIGDNRAEKFLRKFSFFFFITQRCGQPTGYIGNKSILFFLLFSALFLPLMVQEQCFF